MSMDTTCSCGKVPARLAKIPPRVLVVDDEPLVRWSLAAGLRAAGFEALPVADAEEALGLARSAPPDVVLFDIRLWNTDPGRLLADLREAAPACRFLILAVTGQEIPYARFEGVDVIRKPYDLHDVVRTVEATVCAVHRMKSAV
jgi:DNA-binding response OmpR family regulator